eukprot:Nitzschia sp. Nitz4//scaffold68_size99682//82282//83551//NITZ4_004574-RA/size99682-snap-gene-0.5-mRNA-1//1//CDS//3329556623//1592//frame0
MMYSFVSRNLQALKPQFPGVGRRFQSGKSGSASTSVPIGASLAAAMAGVGVVASFAAAVEQATADSCLPYDPSQKGQRFDASTFQGRFCRMLLACDPYLLSYTEEQVKEAQKVLERAGEFASDRSKDHELWEARRITDAALHPDSGDFIPRPFRMSGYVPFNGPICVAMVASTSTPSLLFWSWVNQSQNALVNYFNRNASSPMDNATLMKSYSAAVGSALVVAFGLATFVQKRYPPAQAAKLMSFVAFPSAIVASSLNCYIVRSPEIDSGIHLLNEDGAVVSSTETSKVAAAQGVNSTTLSRAILQAPVYFLPPLLMTEAGPLGKIVARNPATRVPMTTFLLLISFGLGLPATVAIFPQIASIPAEQVEPAFQKLIDPKTQEPYKVFYYNKGL